LTAFSPDIARILEVESLSFVKLYRDDNVVKAIQIKHVGFIFLIKVTENRGRGSTRF
jgi:hypothetical protein